MEFVSDAFWHGDCVAVLAFRTTNPAVRPVNLAISILSFWEDLVPKPATLLAPELAMAPLSRIEGTEPA
jgi:hypothetical protein